MKKKTGNYKLKIFKKSLKSYIKMDKKKKKLMALKLLNIFKKVLNI